MSKRIVVNLRRQVLTAYDGTQQVYRFDCCSGDKDHPTDAGKFKIFSKHRKYTSKKYKVPMDYAMFFTKDGKAIHMSHAVGLTSLLKYLGADSVGSHGCVRLSEDDARTLFEWTPMHTTVEVS